MQKDSPTVDDFKKNLSDGYDMLLALYPNETAYITELRALIDKALGLVDSSASDVENIEAIGEGWTGDESLAMAIYCTVKYFSNFEQDDLKGMTTPITREKLQEADCIVIFDAEHRNAITRVLDYTNWDRIIMFDKQAFGTDTAVMDPHYQTDAVYQSVALHIVEGCKRMIEQWRDNPPTHQV